MYRRDIAYGAVLAPREGVRWAFAAAIAVALLAACKEEWTQHDIHVLNPMSETDETKPAGDDDDAVDATIDVEPAKDAATDAPADAKPADARSDARDATAG